MNARNIPANLIATYFPHSYVQSRENDRVREAALAQARLLETGVFYRPCWTATATEEDDMLAWPNGDIQSADSFDDEIRHRDMLHYWATQTPEAEVYDEQVQAEADAVWRDECGLAAPHGAGFWWEPLEALFADDDLPF